MCELVMDTSNISTVSCCVINRWLVRDTHITAEGIHLIPTLKDTISYVFNCQTQRCSGFSNAAIKMILVSKNWSDERQPEECRNRQVFLPSSTFYNSMTPSDLLSIARNCPSGENWVIPASTFVILNSVLDFGILFSTSHNLIRIKDSSIQLIEIMLLQQWPNWMKTKCSPSILNCPSPLLRF